MLNREDNELLTRVGPGTPMGDMLREYWVPACRSAKLEADGAPERVRLFGENFVAFRATDGRVGFIGEGCPHRCASMALARNEGDGLRCIFHGWKVSVDGVCVDAPTEPPERREEFAKRVPVRHHPVREAGGLVWVYLGQNAEPPKFYDFEFNLLPGSHVRAARGLLHCNWLQGLEALLDSAHVGFLHSRTQRTKPVENASREVRDMQANLAPIFEFMQQPYGFREGAIREQADGTCYTRVREVVLPFFSFIPAPPGEPRVTVAAVPIDDEWTAQWYIAFDPEKPIIHERLTDPQTTSGDPDYFNAGMGTVENMWHQDRQAMKDGHWSGIVGKMNAYEDFIVEESMGPIVDRSKEYLGTCDAVIVRARRMLLDAVHGHADKRQLSFASDDFDSSKIRAVSLWYRKGEDWKQMDPKNPPPAVAA